MRPVAVAIIGAIYMVGEAAAQPPPLPIISVSLRIVADEPEYSELASCVRQRLRQLGDVEVTAERTAQTAMSLVVGHVRAGAGHSISALVLSPLATWQAEAAARTITTAPDQGLINYFNAYVRVEHHWVAWDMSLQALCPRLASLFDTRALEPYRAMLRATRPSSR